MITTLALVIVIIAIILCTISLVISVQKGNAVLAGLMGFCIMLNISNLISFIGGL